MTTAKAPIPPSPDEDEIDETPPTVEAAPEPEPMEAPADKPPKRPRLRRKRSDAGKPRKPRTATAGSAPRSSAGSAAMTRKLTGVINTIGGVISLVEPHDGGVILANAQPLASGWAKVADRHPRVRQAIDGMEAGGVYGAAIAATLAVAVPILAHHRLLPQHVLVLMGLAEPTPVQNTARVPEEDLPPRHEPVSRPAPPRPVSGAPTGTPAEGVPPVTAAPPMPAGSGAPSGAPLPRAG